MSPVTKAEYRGKLCVYRQCKRKVAYYTTKEANTAIQKMIRNGFPRQYYYKCYFCNKYHLTKNRIEDESGR